VGHLEWFEGGRMHRIVHVNGEIGSIAVENVESRCALRVLIDFPHWGDLHHIIARTRAMFDLDSDPLLVASVFDHVPALRQLIQAHPGVRLPSGWDGFETGVATILGQMVSVEHGQRLVDDLVGLAGERTSHRVRGRTITLFPSPQRLLEADLSGLKTTVVRRAAIVEFARKVASGEMSLGATQDVDRFIDQLLAIRGIGLWTARCIALRVLRSTDAFPENDLIVARALKQHPSINPDALRPWRGYAAALFWRDHATPN
jgi:AraC family transcriptional regulator of adaptative response / DNA-3-methyladenine glycosylase II